MKRNILTVMIGMFLSMTSCDKFLEEKPTDFIAPANYYTNEKEVYSALSGVYDMLGKTSTYSRYLYFEMDISDQSYFYATATQDVALFNYDIGDSKILSTWSSLYEGINRANMLLENIDNADMSNSVREVYRGEALFLRAYYYFLLTTNWGQVPLRLTATKNPSEVDMEPATYAQIYEQIIADMITAADKVQDVTSLTNAGRVSKSAVWGILARVNLKKAGAPLRDKSGYTEARKWAKKVIDLNYHRLNADFAQVFKNHSQNVYDTRETIWEVEFSKLSGGAFEEGWVGSINGIGTTNNTIGYSYGAQRVMKPYYDSFNVADERRHWNINNYYYGAAPSTAYVEYTGAAAGIIYNRYASKWRREFETGTPKNTNTTDINFPLLRYADVLLMYAEAANLDPVAARDELALDAINSVRRRAFGKLKSGATAIEEFDLANSLDDVLFQQAIQNERSFELGYEGLRRFDLVRWGIYVQTMHTLLNHKAGVGEAYLRAFWAAENITAKDTLYAIPRNEMTVNKLMKQNKGW